MSLVTIQLTQEQFVCLKALLKNQMEQAQCGVNYATAWLARITTHENELKENTSSLQLMRQVEEVLLSGTPSPAP